MWPDGWTIIPVAGVSVDISAPPFHAECSWPTKTARDDVSIIIEINDTSVTGGGLLIPRTRINLQAASARQTLERATGLKDERREEFARFFKTLAQLIGELYRQQQPIHQLEIVEPKPVSWLLYPLWPATGATGVSAAPGSLKSYAALAVALSVATGTAVLRGHSRVVEQSPVLYLDWEADREETERRLSALAKGRGVDPEGQVSYQAMRHPLIDVVHDLTSQAADYGAVVIDSESAAIGGTMVDDDRVNRFWDAVRAIGLPALVIAHKSVANVKAREARFFGSIMNEARVRMAWNVEVEPDTTNVLWECFKDSNGRMMKHRAAWEWTFTNSGEAENSLLEVVTAVALDPRNVNLRRSDDEEPRTIADGISEILLVDSAASVGELAGLLVKPEDTIRRVLNRHKDRFDRAADGSWRLATLPDPL